MAERLGGVNVAAQHAAGKTAENAAAAGVGSDGCKPR